LILFLLLMLCPVQKFWRGSWPASPICCSAGDCVLASTAKETPTTTHHESATWTWSSRRTRPRRRPQNKVLTFPPSSCRART
jgi:hypothetical protein